MRRFWMLMAFLGFASLSYSQSTGNPFDLQYRTPKPKSSPAVISVPARPDTFKVKPPAEDTSITTIGKSKPDTAFHAHPTNPFEKASAADSANTNLTPVDPKTLTPDKGSPKISPIIKYQSSKGFQIFFLLLSLLFLIFIVNVERSFVRDLWRVIANENYSSLHHRNQRNTMRQILLIMGYAVFIFQAGIFIFHALKVFQYRGSAGLNIWIPILFVLGVYVVRHLVIRYIRWLFNNDKEMTLFGFDISIFNTMVGLVLLPINVLLLFGPESIAKPLIIIGIGAFVTAYLMRQLRWMLTARQLISNSLFLFFIYLCAVEILPLWALSKFFW